MGNNVVLLLMCVSVIRCLGFGVFKLKQCINSDGGQVSGKGVHIVGGRRQ